MPGTHLLFRLVGSHCLMFLEWSIIRWYYLISRNTAGLALIHSNMSGFEATWNEANKIQVLTV